MRLFHILLLTPLSIAGQIPMDVETGKFFYEEVVQAEGISQQELHDRYNLWLEQDYDLDTIVIITQDTGKKAMKGKGTSEFTKEGWETLDSQNKSTLTYDIALYFKEGRFKYHVSNFIYSYYLVARTVHSLKEDALEEIKYLKGKKQKVYEQIDKRMKGLISNLKDKLAPAASEEEDDW